MILCSIKRVTRCWPALRKSPSFYQSFLKTILAFLVFPFKPERIAEKCGLRTTHAALLLSSSACAFLLLLFFCIMPWVVHSFSRSLKAIVNASNKGTQLICANMTIKWIPVKPIYVSYFFFRLSKMLYKLQHGKQYKCLELER